MFLFIKLSENYLTQIIYLTLNIWTS